MEGVEKAVLGLLSKQDIKNRYLLYKLQHGWLEIVGNINAKHSGPVKLDRRILYVEVNNSVWMQQFTFLKEEFLKKIREFLLNGYVRDIKFVIGSSFKNRIKTRQMEDPSRESDKISLPELSDNEKEKVKETLADIKNDSLRECMFRIELKKAALEKLYSAGKIKKCKKCGAYLKEGGEICTQCARIQEEERDKKLYILLRRYPWLSYSDLQGSIECDRISFNVVKEEMKSVYFEKVRLGIADSDDKWIAVHLKTAKAPEEISEREFNNVVSFLEKGSSRYSDSYKNNSKTDFKRKKRY